MRVSFVFLACWNVMVTVGCGMLDLAIPNGLYFIFIPLLAYVPKLTYQRYIVCALLPDVVVVDNCT